MVSSFPVLKVIINFKTNQEFSCVILGAFYIYEDVSLTLKPLFIYLFIFDIVAIR